VDWAKVCEFMGSVRTYNQCRHRWHNVIKHRGINPDEMNGFHGYTPSQPQDQDLAGAQEWAALQQQHAMMQHQLLEQQEQQQHQQQEAEEDPNLAYLQKYDV
jgi:hypothetical protein